MEGSPLSSEDYPNHDHKDCGARTEEGRLLPESIQASSKRYILLLCE